MPGGPRISMPYSAATAIMRAGSGGWPVAGGSERVCAGSASVRMKFSKPAGSATRRKRGFGGGNGECMRDIARPVHERSSRCLYRSATDPKGQVAFDDVEPFVLTMMNVQGRAGPLGSEMLDHGDAAAGHLARGLDRGKDAEEPERLTLILPQGNRVGCAAGGVHGSSFRTTGDLVKAGVLWDYPAATRSEERSNGTYADPPQGEGL